MSESDFEEFFEKVPEDIEDLRSRIENLLEQVQHNISSLKENFEDVVIIARKNWEYKDKHDNKKKFFSQIYYLTSADDILIPISLCNVVSSHLSLGLYKEVITKEEDNEEENEEE